MNHNLYANCMNGLEDKDLRYQENDDIGAAFRIDWKQVSDASILLESKFRTFSSVE